jgi:glutamate racemase
VDVEAQACGGVVDAIEEGDMILAEALVRSHVDALKRKMPNPDAAVLGCTHYPLMEEVFQDALGPGVKVFSQASLVAESLADYLARRPEMVGPGTESRVPHHRRSPQGVGRGHAVPQAQDRVPHRLNR